MQRLLVLPLYSVEFFFCWWRHQGQFPYSCNQILSCNMHKVLHCPSSISYLVYWLCFWWNFPEVSAKVYKLSGQTHPFHRQWKQWANSRWRAEKQTHGLLPFVAPHTFDPSKTLKRATVSSAHDVFIIESCKWQKGDCVHRMHCKSCCMDWSLMRKPLLGINDSCGDLNWIIFFFFSHPL